MNSTDLLALAKQARAAAYAPYSGFSVGAALLTAEGKVFLGCNVENASFTPTCCAERVAIFKAISEGERSFSAIAVVGGKGEETAPMCTPCGVCRQVLSEFCEKDLSVILENEERKPTVFSLGELLPLRFQLSPEPTSEEL